MHHFYGSFIVTAIGLGLTFYLDSWQGLFLCTVLAIMEVSLSFDNAVVNAKVLKDMNALWRRLFLTVGILIAVFGVRLLLPVVLVSFASGKTIMETTQLALYDVDGYRQALHACETSIAAFGGLFLLLLFLNFLFDHERESHWLGALERRLAKVGKLETAPLFVSLVCLLIYASVLPKENQNAALIAGIIGIALFVLLDDLKALAMDEGLSGVARSGFASFCYLEVLDASFSLDGVVGAFAISKSVITIMVGLAIGAYFVRSLTIYLVEKETLDKYKYLEHGAMWAIGSLALLMLLGATPGLHIPEWITGLTGAAIIGLSMMSSIRERRHA